MNHEHSWSISKILVALALIVSAAAVYTVFFGHSQNVSAQSVEEDVVETQGGKEIIGKDLLAVLEKIESIKLDGSIFTDSAFLSLQDYSLTLVPETPGRTNPFAPLPGSKAR